MKIAITQRTKDSDKNKRFDLLEQNYVRFFQSLGVTLIPIPNCLNNPTDYLKEIGATHLIISGGGNIHPKFYKGKVVKGTKYMEDRDNTEKKLLDYAVAKKIPVLGICRGCQFINIYFGGKLIQNLKKNLAGAIKHVKTTHKVNIIDEKIKKMSSLNDINDIKVNSYHNDGITKKELAKDLFSFAESKDRLIEGVYHKNLPIVGIMWHPERKKIKTEFDNKLIDYFIKRKLYWQ